MQKKCDACGKNFDAARKSTKFCQRTDCLRLRARARKQKSLAGGAKVLTLPGRKGKAASSSPENEDQPTGGYDRYPTQSTTKAVLEAAGVLNTPIGAIAMALARQLDIGFTDTGSSKAAVARELKATLVDATRGVGDPGDPIDELTAQRKKRRGA